MRVAVAGGRGFIGGGVVRRLLGNKGKTFEVAVITRNPEGAKRVLPEGVEVISLSGGWERAKEELLGFKPDAIVNAVGILYEDRNNTYEVAHVEVVKHLLEVAKGLNLRRFVQISACGVGRNRFSRYFLTKEEAERLVRTSGVPYTILRPSIVMGEGQLLFKQLKKLAPFTPIFLVPATKVQPVHIEDLVEIVYKTLAEGILENETCEVGGPKVYTMGEFFRRALNLLGYRRLVLELPWWFFVPLLPVLAPLKITTWENLQMVRTENICPDNCTPRVLGKMRDPFEVEV